jgi:hypothetical protein
MNSLIVFTILGGLLLDYHWPNFGQEAASLIVWILCFGLFLRSDSRARPALLACLIIATAGEIFLSLVWGLYTYRLANIPLFVPPGHVLLFYLGTQLATRLPDRAEWWIAALAFPMVMAFAWAGRDTLGPVLFGLFLLCLWLSPARKLYATMFVLSYAMELYGTWVGNWVWSADVPWLGLKTINPPVAAGAFYCVLDLLVVSVTTRLGAGSAAGQPGLEPEGGFDPGGDLEGMLVLAVAPDHLEAEGQSARAEA